MALQNGLYSKQIYWPHELRIELAEVMMLADKPRYTNYYADRWAGKYKSRFPFNIYKVSIHGEPIECEWCDGFIIKVVTRMHNRYNRHQDICFAIAVNGFDTIVKTVWCNDHDDLHNTIDESKYVKEN